MYLILWIDDAKRIEDLVMRKLALQLIDQGSCYLYIINQVELVLVRFKHNSIDQKKKGHKKQTSNLYRNSILTSIHDIQRDEHPFSWVFIMVSDIDRLIGNVKDKVNHGYDHALMLTIL